MNGNEPRLILRLGSYPSEHELLLDGKNILPDLHVERIVIEPIEYDTPTKVRFTCYVDRIDVGLDLALVFCDKAETRRTGGGA